MKPTLPILAGLLAVAAPLGAQNIKIDIDPNKPAQPAAAAPAAPAAAPEQKRDLIVPSDGKYNDAQKLEMYGFIVADQLRMAQFRAMIRSEEEFNGFLRGVAAGIAGELPPYDFKLLTPQTEALIKARGAEVQAAIDKNRAEVNERNQKEAKEFLAKLDATPGIKKTASGLRYEVIQDGTGAKAKLDQAVRAYFKTTLITGEVIATSKGKDGKETQTEFPLATAVPGLKEGLQLVGVGGKVKFYVPAELAFADQGPVPGALMIFEMEILEVKEPTKQPEEKK